MQPEDGRLQTAEHILSRTLEDLYPDAKVIIAAFEGNRGRLEIATKDDPRKTGKDLLEQSVNGIIQRNLRVNTYSVRWEEASIEFDLSRLPGQIRRVRIIEIEGV